MSAPDNGLADYIADNYGRCIVEPCHCRAEKVRWMGQGCLHWQPVQAKTWEELALELRPVVRAAT